MDGEGFLLLSADDIATLVKPLGARRKLINKQGQIKTENQPQFHVSNAQSIIVIMELFLTQDSLDYSSREFQSPSLSPSQSQAFSESETSSMNSEREEMVSFIY